LPEPKAPCTRQRGGGRRTVEGEGERRSIQTKEEEDEEKRNTKKRGRRRGRDTKRETNRHTNRHTNKQTHTHTNTHKTHTNRHTPQNKHTNTKHTHTIFLCDVPRSQTRGTASQHFCLFSVHIISLNTLLCQKVYSLLRKCNRPNVIVIRRGRGRGGRGGRGGGGGGGVEEGREEGGRSP